MTLRPATAAVLTAVVLAVLTLSAYGIGLLETVVLSLAFIANAAPVLVPVALFVLWARRRGDLPRGRQPQ
jgi:hypothetical protein